MPSKTVTCGDGLHFCPGRNHIIPSGGSFQATTSSGGNLLSLNINKSKEKRIMKMELFLQHINQEMIDVKSNKKVIQDLIDLKDLKDKIPDGIVGDGSGWSVWANWSVSCCVADFSKSIPQLEHFDPAPSIMIRKEREGGLIWNKRNQKVFKVDEEAYHVILELDAGVCPKKIAAKHKIDEMEVMRLGTQLIKEFGR